MTGGGGQNAYIFGHSNGTLEAGVTNRDQGECFEPSSAIMSKLRWVGRNSQGARQQNEARESRINVPRLFSNERNPRPSSPAYQT